VKPTGDILNISYCELDKMDCLVKKDVQTRGFWDDADLLVTHGSRLFGCSSPESDIDLRGFVVEPGEYILGRQDGDPFEQYEVNDETGDVVIYGVKKFFMLLESGAPNCIEILFAPEDKIVSASNLGRLVLDNRGLFVSKRLTSQIFGFAESEWRKSQLLTKNKETGEIYKSSRVVGAKRKDSYKEFGYCTRNAYHAIRLLQEGVEIMTTGSIIFPRPNTDELRDIRDGKTPFSELSKTFEALTESFRDEEERSSLPDEVDRTDVTGLFLEVISDSLEKLLQKG